MGSVGCVTLRTSCDLCCQTVMYMLWIESLAESHRPRRLRCALARDGCSALQGTAAGALHVCTVCAGRHMTLRYSLSNGHGQLLAVKTHPC